MGYYNHKQCYCHVNKCLKHDINKDKNGPRLTETEGYAVYTQRNKRLNKEQVKQINQVAMTTNENFLETQETELQIPGKRNGNKTEC